MNLMIQNQTFGNLYWSNYMTIENGKIIKATESELYKYWLDRWSDIYSFDQFIYMMKDKGLIITGKEQLDD